MSCTARCHCVQLMESTAAAASTNHYHCFLLQYLRTPLVLKQVESCQLPSLHFLFLPSSFPCGCPPGRNCRTVALTTVLKVVDGNYRLIIRNRLTVSPEHHYDAVFCLCLMRLEVARLLWCQEVTTVKKFLQFLVVKKKASLMFGSIILVFKQRL